MALKVHNSCLLIIAASLLILLSFFCILLFFFLLQNEYKSPYLVQGNTGWQEEKISSKPETLRLSPSRYWYWTRSFYIHTHMHNVYMYTWAKKNRLYVCKRAPRQTVCSHCNTQCLQQKLIIQRGQTILAHKGKNLTFRLIGEAIETALVSVKAVLACRDMRWMIQLWVRWGEVRWG